MNKKASVYKEPIEHVIKPFSTFSKKFHATVVPVDNQSSDPLVFNNPSHLQIPFYEDRPHSNLTTEYVVCDPYLPLDIRIDSFISNHYIPKARNTTTKKIYDRVQEETSTLSEVVWRAVV